MAHLTKSSILISIALANLVYSLPTDKNIKTRTVEDQKRQDITNETKHVEQLEKEKRDLFNEINQAIDDSVKVMAGSNDTEMLTGIQQLELLKERVRDLNDHKIEVKRRQGGKITSLLTSGETYKVNNDEKGSLREGLDGKQINENNDTNLLRKRYNVLTIGDLIKKNNKKLEKDEQRGRNVIKVQKKLDGWIEQRDLEKMRKREEKIRLRRLTNEKCPRFGTLRKKHPKKYPCCRKCCKQSYLGCL